MNAWDRWVHESTYGLIDYSERVIAAIAGKCVLTYAESRMDACQGGLPSFFDSNNQAFMLDSQLGTTNKHLLH